MALTFTARVGNLNWLYLVEVIVIVVVVLFYLFYFGRTLASILSLVVRTYLWRRHRVSINIGSLQFSPLGGRILFRDVLYVGENQTVRIAMGHITWRYWLWRVRQEDDLRKEDDRLPCRTTIEVEGLEWFVYNRVPAFDALLEKLGYRDAELEKERRRQGGGDAKEGNVRPQETDGGSIKIVPSKMDSTSPSTEDGIDWFREALPVEFHVIRGAVVLGNRSTPSLLIAGFKSAIGTCGAVKPRSKFDMYKQIYQFNFAKPRIVYRRNHDYQSPMAEFGKQLLHEKKLHFGIDPRPDTQTLSFGYFQDFLRRFTRYADYVYLASQQSTRVQEKWEGLERYRQAIGSLWTEEQDRSIPHNPEYAKVSTIYDSGESIDLTYYADVAGYVPRLTEKEKRSLPAAVAFERPDIGNCDLAPEWGVDISLSGGTLTYGPWADRQRAALQKAFFPPTFFELQPTERLQPGDQRLHAVFKLFLEFRDSVTVRVPTREASKDWKYDGRAHPHWHERSPERLYGWLDIQLGPESSVRYTAPMVADSSGYNAMLEVQLDQIKVASVVSSQTVLEAKLCKIFCDLPSPLVWHAARTWTFDIAMEQPELYLLRDHTNLLADLVRDWTSGPPGDLQHFVPFLYKLNLKMTDYQINLYLNERNIVDKPAELDENSKSHPSCTRWFAPVILVGLSIPALTYHPAMSTVSVDLQSDRFSLALLAPAFSTHHSFATERTSSFASADKLDIKISHTIPSLAGADSVETLDIDVKLDGIVFQLLGWVIKSLLSVKENYFGSFSNYRSKEEFETNKAAGYTGDALEDKYREHKAMIFEVNLNLAAQRSVALLAQELHDCTSAVALTIPEFGVHLRNHDFFMELGVDVDPIEVCVLDSCIDVLQGRAVPIASDRNRIVVDGLSITSHRLFGPQPKTAVYVAIWEFYVGKVTGDITIPHFNAFQRAAQSFGCTYADKENAIPADYSVAVDPDVTFLSFSLVQLDINVWSRASVVNIQLSEGVRLQLDDKAADGWLSHIDVRIPSIEMRGLAPAADERNGYLEVVALSSGLRVGFGKTSLDWRDKQAEQRDFLAKQDVLTRRCTFLYSSDRELDRGHVKHFPVHLPALHPGEIWPQERWPQGASGTDNRRSCEQQRGANPTGQRTASHRQRSRTVSRVAHSDKRYSTLLRRFSLQRSQPGVQSFSSEDSPELLRGMDEPQLRMNGQDANSSKHRIRSRQNMYKPQSPDEMLNGIDIQIYKPTRGVCSPAAVQLAEDIIATLEKDDVPEHWLDAIDARYARNYALKPKILANSMHLTLSTQVLQLNLIQDVLRPGDIDMTEQLESDTNQDSSINCQTLLSCESISVDYIKEDVPRAGLAPATKFTLQPAPEGDPFMLFRSDAEPFREHSRDWQQHPLLDEVVQQAPEHGARQPRQALLVEAGRMLLELRHAIDGTSLPDRIQNAYIPKRPSGTALHMACGGAKLQIDLRPESIKVQWDTRQTALQFVSAAAELVTGTVHSWFIVSRRIERAVLAAQYQASPRYRRLLTDIIHLADLERITSEPPVLYRKTLLDPSPLRRESSWKVLVHIRHALRNLPEQARQKLSQNLTVDPTSSAEHDFSKIVHTLIFWSGQDYTPNMIRTLPIFDRLFASKASQSTGRTATKTGGLWVPSLSRTAEASLFWAGFKVEYHEDWRSPNELLIGSSDFYAGLAPASGSYQGSGHLGDPTNTNPPSSEVVARATVGHVRAGLDPNFVQLVRHVGRVRRVFQQALEPLIPRPRMDQPLPEGSLETARTSRNDDASTVSIKVPITFTAVLIGLDIGTRADGVKASIAIAGGHAMVSTVYCHTSGESTLALDGSGALGCDTFKLLISEEGMTYAGEPRRNEPKTTLVSFGMEQIHNSIMLKRIDDTIPDLAVVVLVGSSRVTVPRHLLRVFQFLENWQKEALPKSKVVFEELKRDLENPKVETVTSSRASTQSRIEAPSAFTISLELLMPVVHYHIRAAQAFWLNYKVNDLLVTSHAQVDRWNVVQASTGTRIGSQLVESIAVATTADAGGTINEDKGRPRARDPEMLHLPFPAFIAQVDYAKGHYEVLASLDRMDITIDTRTVDRALAIQTYLESDIDEVLLLVARLKNMRTRRATESGDSSVQVDAIPPIQAMTPTPRATWRARLALRGLNLGLKAVRHTQFFGAELVDGFILQNTVQGEANTLWEINAQNLAAWLEQHSKSAGKDYLATRQKSVTFDRNYRIAYFVLDTRAGNTVTEVSELPPIADGQDVVHFHIQMPKVHAVMQTAAIDGLDEVFEHFRTEFERSRKAGAAELSDLKQKVRETLEIPAKPLPVKVAPWIERCVTSLRIGHVGLVIPIVDAEIQVPGDASSPEEMSPTSRPAFMVSTPSLVFATAKGQDIFLKMSDLAVQFVRDFDQTQETHFYGSYHRTQNRLLLPLAQVTVSPDRSKEQHGKAYTVRAHMSGAVLDIDASIVDSVFSLVELYESGYQRLRRHAVETGAARAGRPQSQLQGAATVKEATYEKDASASQETLTESILQTLLAEGSFEVDEGVINIHSTGVEDERGALDNDFKGPESEDQQSRSRNGNQKRRPRPQRRRSVYYEGRNDMPSQHSQFHHSANYNPRSSVPPDRFIIPKLTMWGIKKAAMTAEDLSLAHVDAVVHSSTNTLHPTLLPFLSDFTEAIKDRLQRQSAIPGETISSPAALATPGIDVLSHRMEGLSQADELPESSESNKTEGIKTQSLLERSGFQKMRLSFSLRLDDSTLTISCDTLSSVVADLSWQTGGFVLAWEPGSSLLQGALRVAEVGFKVRQSYSNKVQGLAGLAGSASGLILTGSFSPLTRTSDLLRIAFNVEKISTNVDFRRYNESLCFKAVWLDRLGQLVPESINQSAPALSGKIPISPKRSQPKTLVKVMLVRLQTAEVVCNLDAKIGTVSAKATSLTIRGRLVPKESRAFSVDLRNLHVESKEGMLDGTFDIDGFYFENKYADTTHSPAAAAAAADRTFNKVRLSAQLGKMDASLSYAYRRVLLLQSDPIQVGAVDDWEEVESLKRLALLFSVRMGSFNVIARAGSVPMLMYSVGARFKQILQEHETRARNDLLGSLETPVSASLYSPRDGSTTATTTIMTPLRTGDGMPKAGEYFTREPGKTPRSWLLSAGSGEDRQSGIPAGVRTIGTIQLEAQRMRLVIFRNTMLDKRPFRADIGAVRAELGSGRDEEGTVVRDLKLHLGFFALRELTLNKVDSEMERSGTMEAWLTGPLKTATERNIVKIPTADAKMISQQRKDSRDIEHNFSVAYTGRVDVSLNYALLKQLKTLLVAYQEAMRGEREAFLSQYPLAYQQSNLSERAPSSKDLGGGDARPGTDGSATQSKSKGSGEESGNESGTSKSQRSDNQPVKSIDAKSIPPPPVSKQVEDGKNNFIALRTDIQQLQVQILGDATPPLEWFGVQSARFPQWTHEGVTMLLEAGLVRLTGLYDWCLQKNLATAAAAGGSGSGSTQ